MKKYNVAIVGSTGAVGIEILRCLFEFSFPFQNITLLASKRSAGKQISYHNHTFIVEELVPTSFTDIDIAFWSAGAKVSEAYMPYALQEGCINIDNTSHFRMDPKVPLIVPEVNKECLREHNGIIANPNCTTIQMVSALYPLHKEFTITKIIVSTYQAVSGAGHAGMTELYSQSREILDGKKPTARILPCVGEKKHYPIAFNCIPQVDQFNNDNGFSKEEMKMILETQKILQEEILINPTCVRVPVERGHSESIYIETKQPIDLDTVFSLLKEAPGIDVYDDITNQIYPMASTFIGDPLVHIGRIRKDIKNEHALSMWVVADQLMKGAAYNSIDIALTMIAMGLL